MDRNKLALIVQEAINMVFARDAMLMTQENSEWSIAHRLAVYLEQMLPGWNIDCEYNRQDHETDHVKKSAEGKIVRPDIIVHHRSRTQLDHNLLAIELKKKNVSQDDLKKLTDYTSPPVGKRKFQYQYGLAIDLSSNPLSLTWFEHGQQFILT